MNKLFSKGKVLVTYVSVLAILAASILSVFSGISFNAFAEEGTDDEEVTVSYPLNDKYDADYIESTGTGVTYEAVDYNKKTVVDSFTDFDGLFLVDGRAKGTGGAGDPYIIETANQFAAVVTGNLWTGLDGNNKPTGYISTNGVCFKIADNVKGFNLNNTGSSFDFSKDTVTSAQVEAAFKGAKVSIGLEWKSVKAFEGHLDGNGAAVYGLMANDTKAGIFPYVMGSVKVTNLTVKNCYFYGDYASAFFAYTDGLGRTTKLNAKHILINCSAYGNVVVSKKSSDAITAAGVLFGETGTKCETSLYVTDCLVYDNIAKHENGKITYGIVGKLHRTASAVITDSIIMDSYPHTLYYGSNAFHLSTYDNVYTNMLTGSKWSNKDTGSDNTISIYNYKYSSTNGVVSAWFERTDSEGVNNMSAAAYSKTLSGTMYQVSASDLKGKAINGLDESRWTYNKDSYPTPKIYKLIEYSKDTNWSGNKSYQYFSGEGTEDSPYMIYTAEELALMLTNSETGKYYKLGTNIAINDTSAQDWTKNAKTWFTSNDVPVFEASFNGGGYTVSGIYYDGTQAGEYAGLIPVVGNTAEIREVTIAYSVINADKGSAGAIAGAVADRCGKVVKFNANTVEDTVEFNGRADFGGIIGNIGYSALQLNDCISKTHGIFNKITGEAKVNRCISLGAYPFGDVANVIAQNIYTDVEGDEFEGVTVLPDVAFWGDVAESSMPGLNFPNSWVATDAYPKPTGAAASAEGEVGQPWSGAIATSYALVYTNENGEPWQGDGSEDYPYIIETPEQLALLVSKGYKPGGGAENIRYYKLAADIYVNDVNGKLWKDKIGCLDWFSQWVNGTYVTSSHINLDGDGYVIHGLFYDHTQGATDYVRVGLFPVLSQYSTIQNLGLANLYFVGMSLPNTDPNYIQDTMGGFIGCIEDFDKEFGLDSHDAEGNKAILADPSFEEMAVKIKNCFIDHNSYISAYYTGGFVASPYSAPILENCIFTGSIGGQDDQYYSGVLTGVDSTYGSQLRGCIAFPTTYSVQLVAGSGGASWRSNTSYHVTIADPVYYFSTKQQYGAAFTKISRPEQRFGDEAKEAMPLLDWAGTSSDGTGDYWTVVDGGTPLPTIFTKHRTKEEFEALSCKQFDTPEVTVSFVTGASEIEVDDLVGEMYSKDGFVLPQLERLGYEFTGWYVFSDYSIEYPYDYFPPRDLILYAGWNKMGVIQDFESYPDTIWDYDEEYWILNKPGVKGGYKNAYVRNGSKSMHLLGNKAEYSDCLLNYEDMLVPGTSYTMTFWVTTDNADNPATLLSLVHNSYPDYLDTATAIENMAVVTGLKVGEWVQYSYSFTARTQWVSLRATGNSSLYFDDIIMASLDGVVSDGVVIDLTNGALSPNTADGISVAVLISAIMACAAVAIISRKNLVEIIED